MTQLKDKYKYQPTYQANRKNIKISKQYITPEQQYMIKNIISEEVWTKE